MLYRRSLGLALIFVAILLLGNTAVATAQDEVFLPYVLGVDSDENAIDDGATLPEKPVPDVPQPIPSQVMPPPTVPQGENQEGENPPETSPEARLQDTDGPYAMPPEAQAAAVEAYDDPGDFTVGGRLGVGTDVPTFKADVIYNVNGTNRIRVQNTSTGANALADIAITTGTGKGYAIQKFGPGFSQFTWSGFSLADWARFRSDSGVAGLILTTGGPSPLIFGTSDSERMRITPTGEVAVGPATFNTWTRMTINGTAGTWNLDGIALYNTNTALYAEYPWTGLYVNIPAGDGVYVYGAGYNGMTAIEPAVDGYYVSSAGDDGVEMWYPGDNGVEIWYPANNGLYVQSAPSNGVYINQGNVGMRVDSTSFDGIQILNAGFDGVWVYNPAQSGLKVYYPYYSGKSGVFVLNGNIEVSQGSFIATSVTLNVPDYVFDDDYKLLSLAELEAFVDENNHLPNVPSISDIEADGVDLGEFTMTLLEKVEELTLYTLQQQEYISTLEARLGAVERAQFFLR